MKKEDFTLYKSDLYDTTYFYDVSWVDREAILLLLEFQGRIKEKYDITLELIFLMCAGVDFMADFMDCPSCKVREEYFNEFEQFLIEKITLDC